MSAGLPYLQKLRKSDLTELAEISNLKDYAPMRKSELEAVLDDHLRVNQTVYQNDPSLSDYYRRLGPMSPAKRVTSMVKSEAPEKKAARKRSKTVEETGATSDGEASLGDKISSMVKTPSRSSLSLPTSVPLPPSPAAVTDAIDQQTTKIRKRVSEIYDESGVHETSENLRTLLSSPVAINIIALTIEVYGLRQEILPGRIAGFFPAIPYITTDKTIVYLPDLFLLLTKRFWAPFTVWMTTSLLLPLLCAYFINIPLKTSLSHQHGTRRATNSQAAPSTQFDPLVYSIAKALTAYIVYAQHTAVFGLFQIFTVTTVSESIPGGYQGIITGATIAGVISLYEAILKKQ